MKKDIISSYIGNVIESCRSINYDQIINIYDVLITAVSRGGKIYICGNGGSASTASHFQTDLNNAFSITLKSMPAICLADNLSTTTAISNDYSYDDVFLHQLKFILNEKDVLITISGSGNSTNVVKAAEYAKNKGNVVVSMVGFDGGRLKIISDFCFHAPVNNMQISEDLHLFCCHLLSTLIRECKRKQYD